MRPRRRSKRDSAQFSVRSHALGTCPVRQASSRERSEVNETLFREVTSFLMFAIGVYDIWLSASRIWGKFAGWKDVTHWAGEELLSLTQEVQNGSSP